MSNSFLYRMGAGFAGAITRQEESIAEPIIIGATPANYGDPVKLAADGSAIALAGAEAAADIYGFLVRPFPTQSSTNTMGAVAAVAGQSGDIMRHGYMGVKVNGATAAAKGGIVYVRIANAAAGKPIGGIEAAADGGNTIIVTGAKFLGPADANGISEIWIS
jgi:hypothetical protein